MASEITDFFSFRLVFKGRDNIQRLTTKTGRWTCPACPYCYRFKRVTIKHIAKCHPSSKPSHSCDECPFKTYWPFDLDLHRKQKHPMQRHWPCPVCPFSAHNILSTIHHVEMMHASRQIEWHQCDQCPYRTLWAHDFTRHERYHLVGNKWLWTCQKCNYSALIKHVVSRHMLQRHREALTWFRCEMCDFETLWEVDVGEHVELVHKVKDENKKQQSENKWLWLCQTCNYSSLNKAITKRHMSESHDVSRLKMYECERCGFQSYWQKEIDAHDKERHNSEEQAGMHCKMCAFSSCLSAEMQKHVKYVHYKRVRRESQLAKSVKTE